jgi:adenylate cyclase
MGAMRRDDGGGRQDAIARRVLTGRSLTEIKRRPLRSGGPFRGRLVPVEIERKFLVESDAWRRDAGPGRRFCQGHVAKDGKASVRVRRTSDKAYLTVKGARTGISRAEFEYEIPVGEAEEMLQTLCIKPLLEKTRYCVVHDGMTWEVDVFAGPADGLVVAEVELSSADQPVSMPEWIGAEVTNDPRYRSSAIVAAPQAVMPDPHLSKAH